MQLSSQKKHVGSGSAKLAAFKAKSSSSSGSSTPTIREQTEEERKANMLISDSVDRAKGVDRSQEALKQINEGTNQQTTESQAKNILNRYDKSPLRPDRVQNILGQESHEKQVEDSFGLRIARKASTVTNPIYNYLESKRIAAQEEGYKQAENVQMSNFSLTIAEKGKSIADDIWGFGNSGVKISPLDYLLDKPYILPKVTTITGGLVESTSMLPGGVETIVKSEGKVLPSAITVGAVGTAKGMGEQLAQDPAQFAVDFAVTYAVFAGVGKGASSIKNTVKFAGKEPVPIETLARPEVISGEVKFPTAPKETPIPEIMEMFSQTGQRYPGVTNPAKEYGIHATDGNLPKAGSTLAGRSESPGLYVGPDASLHFTRIMGESKPKIQLFGSDAKAPDPSINFFEMKSIERLPGNLRDNLPAANEFMLNSAEKGVGYTTVKMEKGLKYGPRERELVIPKDTEFSLKESSYFTEINGNKVPVKMYETGAPKEGMIGAAERFIGKRKSYGDYIAESSKYNDAYSLITPNKIRAALLGSISSSVSEETSRSNRPFLGISSSGIIGSVNRESYPFNEPSIIRDIPSYPFSEKYNFDTSVGEPTYPGPYDYDQVSKNTLIDIPDLSRPVKFDLESDSRRSKKNPLDININIKKGRRKNEFGDVNKILFGR